MIIRPLGNGASALHLLPQRRPAIESPLPPPRPVLAPSSVGQSGRNPLEDLLAALGSAVADLDRVLGALSSGIARSVSGATGGIIPATRGLVAGTLPAGPSGSHSRLVTTREVNEQVSTVRSSSAPLALDLTTPETPSTIGSTAEINTARTSYEKVQLRFQDSTSVATLHGVFAGTGIAADLTSLTIDLKSRTTVGDTPTEIHIQIRNQANENIHSVRAEVRAGEVISLGPDIGLGISFSAGTIERNEKATTAVSRTTPTDVNPDATFNNPDVNLRPRFENNQQVTAGSFLVNGTRVDVHAGDSINTVLARIGSVVPGVSASFQNDRVTLTTTGPSEDDIVLSNDTSGFLAAVKLAGASTTRGVVRDDRERLSGTEVFGAVTAGSFRVNGQTVTIDPNVDSLQTVLARVNALGAGVTARFDEATRRVIFTPDQVGGTLVLDGDTTGFLSAAGIFEGARGTRVNPNARFDGTGLGDPLFDPGVRVTAGSFEVNGVRIQVHADDTIRSVLSRITSSAANVSATFDDATETIQLTSKLLGPTQIRLGGDTSGFLAAVKLDGNLSFTPGEEGGPPPLGAPLSSTDAFSGVRPGTLTVNGQTLAIDPDVDTLQGLLDALRGLGINALLEGNSIRLESGQPGGALELQDTSGLLAALGISAGTYRGRAGGVEESTLVLGPERVSDPGASLADLRAAVGRLNQVLRALSERTGETREAGADVRRTLAEAFARLEQGLGRAFHLDLGQQPQIQLDDGRLRSVLAGEGPPLVAFLASVAHLAEALRGVIGRAEHARRAAERDVSFTERARFSLAPGVAEGLRAAVERHVVAVAGPASLPRLEDAARSTARAEKARRSYQSGAPDDKEGKKPESTTPTRPEPPPSPPPPEPPRQYPAGWPQIAIKVYNR